MIRFHSKVFEYTLTAFRTYYTPIVWNDVLGESDSIGICAIAWNTSFARTLTIAIEHSSDGVNWLQKNSFPEINLGTFAAFETPVYGADTSKRPTLGQARLRIQLASGTARVKVYVVVRDRAQASAFWMKVSQMTSHLRASVLQDLAWLGKRLKALDTATRKELIQLFKEAKFHTKTIKSTSPPVDYDKSTSASTHVPDQSTSSTAGEVHGVTAGSVAKQVPDPLDHKLSYVFEHLSPHARKALSAIRPALFRVVKKLVQEAAGYAASLLGIRANMGELAALASKGLTALIGSVRRGRAGAGQIGLPTKDDPSGNFDDWSEATTRAQFGAIDDIDEEPWDDGMGAYAGSENRSDVRSGYNGGVQRQGYWHPGLTANRVRLLKPPGSTAAHQEVDQMLQQMSSGMDEQIFEILYGLIVPGASKPTLDILSPYSVPVPGAKMGLHCPDYD